MALLLICVSFTITTCHSCGVLPQNDIYHKIALGIKVSTWTMCLVDALWIQVASNAVHQMVQVASTQVLLASKGTRALGMAWSIVILLTLSPALSLWMRIKEKKAQVENKDPVA